MKTASISQVVTASDSKAITSYKQTNKSYCTCDPKDKLAKSKNLECDELLVTFFYCSLFVWKCVHMPHWTASVMLRRLNKSHLKTSSMTKKPKPNSAWSSGANWRLTGRDAENHPHRRLTAHNACCMHQPIIRTLPDNSIANDWVTW